MDITTVIRMGQHWEASARLRESGVRVTAQRLAVLRALAERPHSTADDVADLARAEIGAISRQSVYDTLSVLAERGILRRIQPAGSPARYEPLTGDNHHHLVCRTCGRMVDVDCAVGAAPCLWPDDDKGYEIDEAEVIYWGRCPTCRATSGHSGSSAPGVNHRHTENEERDEH